jgi:hypothetical protein
MEIRLFPGKREFMSLSPPEYLEHIASKNPVRHLIGRIRAGLQQQAPC